MEERNSSDLTEQAKCVTIVDYLQKDKIKKGFIKNVKSLLDDGNVEGIKLDNIETLKQVFNNQDLQNVFCNDFLKNFSLFYNDDLYMKSQDFTYQLDMFINKSLIPYYENSDINFIIDKVKDYSINSDLDLYSAVSYDDSDKELINEFNEIIKEKEIEI